MGMMNGSTMSGGPHRSGKPTPMIEYESKGKDLYGREPILH